MKKKIIKLLFLTICLLFIAACGGVKENVPVEEQSVADSMLTKEHVAEELPEAPKSGEISEPEATTRPEADEDTEVMLEPEPVAAITPETLGNPRSSYGLGSAPYLEGTNLLVSMFVTTPESGWSEEEKQTILNKISVATEYIETKAAEYGTELQLIYDYKEYPGLYAEATTDFCINEETDFLDRLDEEIALWFETSIDYDALLTEYQAEGIATMVLVNNPGISYAIVYDGTDNIKESLVLFTGDYYNGGKQEKPVTYAHEIMHLFGAHDLYEEAEFTAEVTDYVEQTYPKEIMLTVTGSGNTNNVIDADLSPITAYHLGWIDETDEIEMFPQLNRE